MSGKTRFTRLIVFFSLFVVSGVVSAQDISKDLAVPVIRLEKHLMSLDYYDQFLGGDYIFEDYMYEIFRMDQGDFEEGEGVVLGVMFGQDGSLLFEQALLSATERQSRWWMIHLSSRDYEIYYEVEVHDSGVPLRIRFINPESGTAHERQTVIGEEFLRVVDSLGLDVIRKKVEEERSEDIRDFLRGRFRNARPGGETQVDTPFGRIKAKELINVQEGNVFLRYLISSQVPGGLAGILAEADDNTHSIVTLVNVEKGYSSKIGDEMLVPEIPSDSEEISSQGSVDDPVTLVLNDYINSSVAEGGVSYFRFVVPYSMDLVVEMAEFTGLVDLVDYAEDESYQSWHTLSSGSEYLTLEYYDLAEDTVIHFAVEDIIDDYSSGENFVIGIRED